MKTREFIEKVTDMSCNIIERKCTFEVWDTDVNKLYASIPKHDHNSIYINSKNHSLIELCIEYMETPIRDREIIPLYRVQLPDEENLSEDRVYVLARVAEGTIMINRPKLEVFKESQRYMLTEEEIKRNHSYLWQFRKEIK